MLTLDLKRERGKPRSKRSVRPVLRKEQKKKKRFLVSKKRLKLRPGLCQEGGGGKSLERQVRG